MHKCFCWLADKESETQSDSSSCVFLYLGLNYSQGKKSSRKSFKNPNEGRGVVVCANNSLAVLIQGKQQQSLLTENMWHQLKSQTLTDLVSLRCENAV